MIDIKIILLLIGIFFTTVGFINFYKADIDKQIIYNIVPRDVYDEIFFSLPIVQYDSDFNKLINPQFILDDPGNYNSLYLNSETQSKYDGYPLMNSDTNTNKSSLFGIKNREECDKINNSTWYGVDNDQVVGENGWTESDNIKSQSTGVCKIGHPVWKAPKSWIEQKHDNVSKSSVESSWRTVGLN